MRSSSMVLWALDAVRWNTTESTIEPVTPLSRHPRAAAAAVAAATYQRPG